MEKGSGSWTAVGQKGPGPGDEHSAWHRIPIVGGDIKWMEISIQLLILAAAVRAPATRELLLGKRSGTEEGVLVLAWDDALALLLAPTAEELAFLNGQPWSLKAILGGTGVTNLCVEPEP